MCLFLFTQVELLHEYIILQQGTLAKRFTKGTYVGSKTHGFLWNSNPRTLEYKAVKLAEVSSCLKFKP